jgi:hypothetical protein
MHVFFNILHSFGDILRFLHSTDPSAMHGLGDITHTGPISAALASFDISLEAHSHFHH